VVTFVSLLLTPRQTNHGTHCTGGRVGPRDRLNVMEKRKISCPYQESNSDSSVAQLRAYLCNTINVRAVTYVPCYGLMLHPRILGSCLKCSQMQVLIPNWNTPEGGNHTFCEGRQTAHNLFKVELDLLQPTRLVWRQH
jgi:hypothetical protein